MTFGGVLPWCGLAIAVALIGIVAYVCVKAKAVPAGAITLALLAFAFAGISVFSSIKILGASFERKLEETNRRLSEVFEAQKGLTHALDKLSSGKSALFPGR